MRELSPLLIGVVIVYLTSSPNATAVEFDAPVCQDYGSTEEGRKDLGKGGVDVRIECRDEKSDESPRDSGRGPKKAPKEKGSDSGLDSKKELPELESVVVSACDPRGLDADNLSDCPARGEALCGDSGQVWVKTLVIDRSGPEPKYTSTQLRCAPESELDETGSREGGGREPNVTIDEIRSLLVDAPEIKHNEDGLSLRNAHINFYTDAETVTIDHEIDGVDLTIRAEPQSYTWDYGDGSAPRTTTTPGEQATEFDVETATSHVYEQTGTYDVQLTTTYAGSYSLDGGRTWTSVPGDIDLESDPVEADIWRVETRNVSDDCATNPRSWGCGSVYQNEESASGR